MAVEEATMLLTHAVGAGEAAWVAVDVSCHGSRRRPWRRCLMRTLHSRIQCTTARTTSRHRHLHRPLVADAMVRRSRDSTQVVVHCAPMAWYTVFGGVDLPPPLQSILIYQTTLNLRATCKS